MAGDSSNSSRSKRPYLVRAMHEWMGDNEHTPYIVVDTSIEGVAVPDEHVKDGKIILNISHAAAHNLKLSNSGVSFRARFGGVPFDVWVPIAAVLGIYAKETGQGHDLFPRRRQSGAARSGRRQRNQSQSFTSEGGQVAPRREAQKSGRKASLTHSSVTRPALRSMARTSKRTFALA